MKNSRSGLLTCSIKNRSGAHRAPLSNEYCVVSDEIKESSQHPSGISLISLIITIIVIIILATIVIFNGLNTPNSANFAKFTQQVDNVYMAVTNKYGDLLQKHSLANETRTQEQIYLEIATGKDQGINGYMCTTGK